MARTLATVDRLFWWESLVNDVTKFVSTLCNMSEKQGSSPQAFLTITIVTSSGEALAYSDLRFYCQAS
jgi:hypothetical protein